MDKFTPRFLPPPAWKALFALLMVSSSLILPRVAHAQGPDIQIEIEYADQIELERAYNITTVLVNNGTLFAHSIEFLWDVPKIEGTDQPVFSIQPIEKIGPEELFPGENMTIVWRIIGHKEGEHLIGFYVVYYDLLNNRYISPSPPKPTIHISVVASPQEPETQGLATPGFPFEALALGITVAVIAIYALRRRGSARRTSRTKFNRP